MSNDRARECLEAAIKSKEAIDAFFAKDNGGWARPENGDAGRAVQDSYDAAMQCARDGVDSSMWLPTRRP